MTHFFKRSIKDPTNNCLDVAIITSPEKRTKATINKLKNELFCWESFI